MKLDIRLNNEVVDALSFIVHADKAYARGRKMAEKLKETIPRQMFEIPIQACIGSKVIARKQLRHIAKMYWQNVMAAIYHEKLLEKQKEGKSGCGRWEA